MTVQNLSYTSEIGPISEVNSPIELASGRIPHCPHNQCGFRCCTFNQGNYIAAYPQELSTADSHGLSLSHLRVVGKIGDGDMVICTAKDTSTCDNGYKPLDCRSYPFFPTITQGNIIEANLKGIKCPIESRMIPWHRAWVIKTWRKLAVRHPGIYTWLATVKLVGYEDLSSEDPQAPGP